LPSHGTQFNSKVTRSRMDGKFLTPGNPEMKFNFSKTDKEKLKSIYSIDSALSPYDLYKRFSIENLIEDFDVLTDAVKSHPKFYLDHPYGFKFQQSKAWHIAPMLLYNSNLLLHVLFSLFQIPPYTSQN